MIDKTNFEFSAAKKVLIAAHRGTACGNIPCNTLAAYDVALRQGADIIEVDVDRTSDGKLVIFHPGKEAAHLNTTQSIKTMTYADIRKQVRYVNYDRAETEYSLCTLEDVFQKFGDRCFINVDKFWDNPREIVDVIRACGVENRVIVKTEPKPHILDIMEEYAPEIPYMPIIRMDNVHEMLLRRKINYVGAEVLFEQEDNPLCSKAFLDKMHRDGKYVWVNAIVYDYKAVLAAFHSDDVAMQGDPAKGWGWLVDQGFDIIQTDWTGELCRYLNDTGRLYKK